MDSQLTKDFNNLLIHQQAITNAMGTLQIELDNHENDERLQYIQSTTLNFSEEEDFDDVSFN